MRFGLIAYGNSQKDACFAPCEPSNFTTYGWSLRKSILEAAGHTIHTLDMYNGPDEVDWVFCEEWNPIAWNKAIQAGYGDKMIYIQYEADVVVPFNSTKNYGNILQFFQAIMTFDDSQIDQKTVYKSTQGYYFDFIPSSVPWEERKLLCSVSAAKLFDHPNGMYRDRIQVWKYFQKEHPEDFAQYGNLWNQDYLCYYGACKDKREVYHQFRFALCLENVVNESGYVTEKIFDCFCAGIVPIYVGAPNADDYIPRDSYIDYRQFENPEEMYQFLSQMAESEHAAYLEAAQRFLHSDVVRKFECEAFTRDMIAATQGRVPHPVSFLHKALFRFTMLRYRILHRIYNRHNQKALQAESSGLLRNS